MALPELDDCQRRRECMRLHWHARLRCSLDARVCWLELSRRVVGTAPNCPRSLRASISVAPRHCSIWRLRARLPSRNWFAHVLCRDAPCAFSEDVLRLSMAVTQTPLPRTQVPQRREEMRQEQRPPLLAVLQESQRQFHVRHHCDRKPAHNRDQLLRELKRRTRQAKPGCHFRHLH